MDGWTSKTRQADVPLQELFRLWPGDLIEEDVFDFDLLENEPKQKPK